MEPHISGEASGLLITKGFGVENRVNRDSERIPRRLSGRSGDAEPGATGLASERGIDFHPYGEPSPRLVEAQQRSRSSGPRGGFNYFWR